MQIQSASACAALSLQDISPRHKPASAVAAASSTAAVASFADAVANSQAARGSRAAQPDAAATAGNAATAVFETDQGSKNLNIDAYFSPATGTGASLSSLPPLLLPNQNNIDALARHISASFPQFLTQNHIPSAPSSITYDSNGQIQLPPDYAYAAQFKQALERNPALARELSTVHALASHLVEMRKAIPFQQEYAAAATQAEADAVVAKYSYLFSGNHHYDIIVLQFSARGSLSLTDDGKPLS